MSTAWRGDGQPPCATACAVIGSFAWLRMLTRNRECTARKGWLGGMSASPMRSQAQSVIAVQASSVPLSQRNTAG